MISVEKASNRQLRFQADVEKRMKNKVLNRSVLLFTTLKDEQRPSAGQTHQRSNSAAVKSPWLQKTSVLTAPKSYFRFDLTRLNKTGSLLQKKREKKGKKEKNHYVAC